MAVAMEVVIAIAKNFLKGNLGFLIQARSITISGVFSQSAVIDALLVIPFLQ